MSLRVLSHQIKITFGLQDLHNLFKTFFSLKVNMMGLLLINGFILAIVKTCYHEGYQTCQGLYRSDNSHAIISGNTAIYLLELYWSPSSIFVLLRSNDYQYFIVGSIAREDLNERRGFCTVLHITATLGSNYIVLHHNVRTSWQVQSEVLMQIKSKIRC